MTALRDQVLEAFVVELDREGFASEAQADGLALQGLGIAVSCEELAAADAPPILAVAARSAVRRGPVRVALYPTAPHDPRASAALVAASWVRGALPVVHWMSCGCGDLGPPAIDLSTVLKLDGITRHLSVIASPLERWAPARVREERRVCCELWLHPSPRASRGNPFAW